MTASIDLRGVTLDYAIYSVRAQSLRNAVLNMAVGGKLLKNKQDVTVVRALSNISFNLQEGDRLALVGHNGSGKTSLLRVIAGIYEASQGEVDIKGKMTSMISMHAGLDFEASGLQNIRNLAMMQMMPKKEVERRLPDIVDFCELGAFIHMPFKTYSAGMMARLVFSVATSMDADVLVMDEWLGAGDASFLAKVSDRLQKMVETARIVVIATHDHGLARRVCNKICHLDAGQISYFGPAEDWGREPHAA